MAPGSARPASDRCFNLLFEEELCRLCTAICFCLETEPRGRHCRLRSRPVSVATTLLTSAFLPQRVHCRAGRLLSPVRPVTPAQIKVLGGTAAGPAHVPAALSERLLGHILLASVSTASGLSEQCSPHTTGPQLGPRAGVQEKP